MLVFWKNTALRGHKLYDQRALCCHRSQTAEETPGKEGTSPKGRIFTWNSKEARETLLSQPPPQNGIWAETKLMTTTSHLLEGTCFHSETLS